MSIVSTSSPVPERQVSAALDRVHGRLRRRRRRLVSAGAGSFAAVLVVGLALSLSGPVPESDDTYGMAGPDAIEPGAGPVVTSPGDSCGRIPAHDGLAGVELTIEGRTEWSAAWTALGPMRPVRVTVRNLGDDPLTVWSPSVVGVADGSFIATEPGPPSLLPTTWTIEPTETIQLPASLPDRSCSGVRLGPGRYEFVPLIGVVRGDRLAVVSGEPTHGVYR